MVIQVRCWWHTLGECISMLDFARILGHEKKPRMEQGFYVCSCLKEIQAIFKTGLPQIHHQQTPPTHCGPPAEGQGLINHRTEGWHLTNEGSWQIHASAYHTPDMVGCFYMVLHSGIIQQVWYFLTVDTQNISKFLKMWGTTIPSRAQLLKIVEQTTHKQFPCLPHQTTSKQENQAIK